MATPRSIKGAMKQCKDYYAKREKARIAKEKAEEEYNKFNKLYWGDLLIKPIAKQLIKHFPGRVLEILGPFGLNCEISVWFKKKGVDEKHLFDTKDTVKSITFRPGNVEKGEFRVVSYEEDTKEFKENSIGAMNGMNFKSIPVTKNTTIRDLLKYVK